MTNARGLLMPQRLTSRTSWMPGGALLGTVTLKRALTNGGGCPCRPFFTSDGGGALTSSALTPGTLNCSSDASSRSSPLSVKSKVVLGFAPLGARTCRRGDGGGGTGGGCDQASRLSRT